MKVILTGVTGFVGSECLRQCLSNPKVTSVVALTRRSLEESQAKDADLSNPKLKVIIQKDFLSYSSEVIKQLEGADACIWNLGTLPNKHKIEETTKTAIDFPMAAINAWMGKIKPAGSEPFRFVYVSGTLAQRDQNKTSLLRNEYMKIRGEIENRLVATEDENPETFKTYIVGMGLVLVSTRTLVNMLPGVIKVDDAAACMIELALNGGDKQRLSNADMKALGSKALARA